LTKFCSNFYHFFYINLTYENIYCRAFEESEAEEEAKVLRVARETLANLVLQVQ
jgi:hypothetical protein